MKQVIQEYNGNEITVVQFEATLLSLSDQVKMYDNENKTEYRVSTIQFVTMDGEIARCAAIIPEKNVQHGMVVGEKYLATATPTSEGGVFVSCSHLIYGGGSATPDMFGLESAAKGIKSEALAAADPLAV